jgi:restriction endonuclease S subunit
MSQVNEVAIGDVIYVEARKHKIKKSEYLTQGIIPVIDQSQEFIAGYINDETKAYDGPLPVIVFGDHTCTKKFIKFPFAVGADGTQLIRPKNQNRLDIRYLFYALFVVPVEQFGYQRHFKYLKDAKILPPDIIIQRKIASILSVYDNLIENNLRRIKILEEMAQLIYREWFVKFRFPGHEKVRMVDSPLGKIPEGWEAATLGDVLAHLESGSRPKGGIDPEAQGVPSIGAENIIGLGRYDYSKEKFVTREFFDQMKHGHIQSGDVLLYKDGALIGRKSMFRDGFPYAECCINEHVFILRTNEFCSQNYLFFWLDLPEMTQNIINLNANAAQPGINQAGVRGLPILVPPIRVLKQAEALIEPLMAMLFNLAKKANVLRRSRDLLLPKLISGELDVSDLDIKVREDLG